MIGVQGVLAQLGVAVDALDLPQVAEVEQPADVVHLHLVDAEPLDQPRAEHGVHAGPDLESHDLAEAPAA